MDLALRLTLLDVLLRPVGNAYIRPLVLGIAVSGLLSSSWLRHPMMWLILSALLATRVVLDWPLADNHAYLLAYWCLAIALACFFADALNQHADSYIGWEEVVVEVWRNDYEPETLQPLARLIRRERVSVDSR